MTDRPSPTAAATGMAMSTTTAPPVATLSSMARRQAQARRRREAQMASWARSVLRSRPTPHTPRPA